MFFKTCPASSPFELCMVETAVDILRRVECDEEPVGLRVQSTEQEAVPVVCEVCQDAVVADHEQAPVGMLRSQIPRASDQNDGLAASGDPA
jgi:hypothetical protein